MVFGVCMKYLKDVSLSEDATQTIFEKVIREIGKYEIPYFKSWLYSVAKNHCLMELRKSPSKFNMSSDDISTLEIQSEDIQDIEFEDSLKEEQIKTLRAGLEQIKKEQSQCLNLFYLQHKSYKEIEKITGFTFREIKSHIQNGKRNLRIILNKIQHDQ